jgi:PAS domain S-box-containing protein
MAGDPPDSVLARRVRELEAELATAIQRGRAVLDNTFQFIGILTRDGVMTDVNRSALAFIGLDWSDVVGKPFWETPWWTHSASEQAKLRDAIMRAARGEFVRFETTHTSASGVVATIDFSLKPVRDATGVVALLVPEGRDISDRKRMEDQLRRAGTELEERVAQRTADLTRANAELKAALAGTQSAERFRDGVMDAVADPVFVKDEQLRHVAVNDAMCEFFRIPRERLMHRTDEELFPADEVKVFREYDERVLATGEPSVNEEQVTDGHGQVHIISTRKTLYRDEAGGRFIVGVVRDLTDIRKAQRQLAENLAVLNSVIENLPMCVKLVRRDGRLLEMNPAGLAMIGATREQAIGGSVLSLVAEDDRAGWAAFHAAVCGGEKRQHRFRMLDLQGRVHQMESLAVPLQLGSAGEVVQLGLTRDVTGLLRQEEERQKLEGRLRHAEQMEALGTLAGGVAHDFNNILSALLGFAERALLDLPAGGRAAEDIQQVLTAGGRARDLVRQILAFSRKAELEYKPTRLQPVVAAALKLLRASIPSTIEFVVYVDDACGPVMADASQINQVLFNLCTNASHAMRERGGLLRVGLHEVSPGLGATGPKAGTWVELVVGDTGHGIEPALLDRIYEPYFTTKPKGEGTGLGLSVVHGIVKAHHGEISVESTLGEGTTFRVLLPRIGLELASEQEHADVARGAAERVLLVDDEQVLATVLERLLTELGYRVTVFSDSTRALDAFRRDPGGFDVCVFDVTMPHLTGDRLAGEVLALRPAMPVLLQTGFSDNVDEERARALGVRELLRKPVSRVVLAGALRRALDGDAVARGG